jgi:uncharacterized hydrophobic protein (TIGR00271 family)
MACVLVVMSEAGLALVPWARQVAGGAGQQLLVVCASKDGQGRLEEVRGEGEGATELCRAAVRALSGGGSAGGGGTGVYDCRGPKVRRAVLDAAAQLHARRLVIPIGAAEERGQVREIARAAPVEVLLLDPGGVEGGPGRVVVPQLGGGGGEAVRFAARYYAGEGGEVVVVADPDAATRSGRVFGKVHEKLPDEKKARVRQERPSGSFEEAVGTLLQTGDLVLLDAEKPGLVTSQLGVLAALRKDREGVDFAVGVVRAEDAAGPGRWSRWAERVRVHLPRLSREERQSVHEMLDRGGRLSADFVVMMMLSTGIATLGLIQSSTATVIGAMLVAPLMTPLLAIAVSMVQGNLGLFRKAWVAVGLGVAGALAVSMLLALLSPWNDLSAEVVARGVPNPFDLGVALLSGIAAAFAVSRSGLEGTLVGVAIAVALVPPLGSVGIATVRGELAMAAGALVLFLTNFFAIIGGAALVFRLFGLDASRRGKPVPRWVVATAGGMMVAMIPVVLALVTNLDKQVQQGVQRSYARPLPSAVRAAVTERVAREPGVEVVLMAESAIEHGFGREVVLMAEGPVGAELAEDIKRILGGDDGVAARVMVLRSAAVEPSPRP